MKLLNSLDIVLSDGDSEWLEIWIDWNKKDSADYATVQVAKEFHWTQDPTRVHVQTQHAGIYGQ